MEIKVLSKINTYLNILKKVNLSDTRKSIKPCDVLLFCHDVDRGVSLNHKAYSPLLDSIKDEFEGKGFSCITIAHPWSEIIGERGYGNPIAINRAHLLFTILNKLSNKLGYRSNLRLYEKIIAKAEPKLIITIGCNNELCEAARNLEVFHAELLHGIGYNPMPWEWDKKEKKHLPQCILSLDEVSTQTFLELERHKIIIKEVSHPFLKRFQGKDFNKIPKEWLPSKRKTQYDKEILISLQWGYIPGIDEHECFKGILVNGLFYSELEEVIQRTNDSIFWRFRFHPVQYRQPEKYKQLFNFIEKFVSKYKNCDWHESTYIPLPSLLSQCSGHITMSSMTNYEAAYLGVPTLALCPSLRAGGIYEEFFNDLVEKGYLIKHASNANFILDWVRYVEKKEPLLKTLNDNQDTVDWLLLQTESFNKNACI